MSSKFQHSNDKRKVEQIRAVRNANAARSYMSRKGMSKYVMDYVRRFVKPGRGKNDSEIK